MSPKVKGDGSPRCSKMIELRRPLLRISGQRVNKNHRYSTGPAIIDKDIGYFLRHSLFSFANDNSTLQLIALIVAAMTDI
jgi:hypothetical protein